MTELDPAHAAALVTELQAQFERRFGSCPRHQTHISDVLLAGDDAYKFKKPVNLGFLDFTTLAARRRFCAREVALNQRYAPALYRGVRALLRGPDGRLAFDIPGVPLDYAVWMRRFPEADRLDRLVDNGQTDSATFAQLGTAIGDLHRTAPRAAADSIFGSAALAAAQMLDGIDVLGALSTGAPAILATYRTAVAAARPLLAARQAHGFIRDCHGDLHLSNLVKLGAALVPFDCIEFSDELRFIDTLSDFAFLKMDLDLRGLREFSSTLLNHYLAACGDYRDLGLLRLYAAYRSLIRAKVAWIGSRSLAAAREDALQRATAHLQLAGDYLAPPPPARLLITHGVSGSGKSWRSRRLAATHGFIHLRSDVERRRLSGLAANEASGSALGAGIYGARRSEETYRHLRMLAAALLRDRYPVVVDAAFLRAADRAAFRALANESNVPFHVLDCAASPDTLRARIRARQAAGGDPSEATEAVLERQLATSEALTPQELTEVIADQDLGGGREGTPA